MQKLSAFKNVTRILVIGIILTSQSIFNSSSFALANCTPFINSNTTLGKTNQDITRLQQCLREAGTFTHYANTGYYGQVTQKALTDYQALKTKEQNQQNQQGCKRYITNTTVLGNTNNETVLLQQCLREAGFFKHPSNTGYFGQVTQKALDSYLANPVKIVSLTNIGQSYGDSRMDQALDSFYNNHKGQRWTDPYGYSEGECVSLAKRWQNHIGAKFGIWPGVNGFPAESFDLFLKGDKSMAPDNTNFTISNISNWQDLRKGDIVITKAGRYYSHTGIATGIKDGSKIQVIEQNNPANTGVVIVGNIDTSNFKGALRANRR
jgi:CHAP domain